ncbi:MAG: DUF3540 domain-containing protein [Alcaligenaceae bacterium]|nr:DUF3540 domain-containing protein [Alcaligenaceae bacterium]
MVRKLNAQSLEVDNIACQQEPRERAITSELVALLRKQRAEELTVTASVVSCKAKINARSDGPNDFLVEEVQTNQLFTVKLATSCLQIPREGDIVHIQVFSDDSAYIMAILESNQCVDEVVTLKLPDNTLFEAKGLSFDTEEFKLSTKKVFIDSQTTSINSISYRQTGLNINFDAVQISQAAKRIEVIAEKATTRVMNSDKLVSGMDRVRALNVNYSAEAVAKLSGNVTMINGHELLKSDGKLMVVG